MKPWKRYRYSVQPDTVPIGDVEPPIVPTDAEFRCAGFDPADEETSCAVLTEDWNGHPAGSRVITGLQLEGYPFAIES